MAIDPRSLPPPISDRSTEDFATLRTPLGVDRALSLLEELFRRIAIEDGEGLDRLFTPDATTVMGPSSSSQTSRTLPFWQGRFRKLDYTRLAGETLYREAEVQIFRGEDPVEYAPHASMRSIPLDPSDVVLRVQILVPRVGADRLFGDEMVLWLRRDGDGFRIYRTLEDFQLN